jgi:hypothetical protein
VLGQLRPKSGFGPQPSQRLFLTAAIWLTIFAAVTVVPNERPHDQKPAY